MKIEIINIKLLDCINILDKLPLMGLKSIHRTRLCDRLITEIERVSKEERQLKEEHSNKDEEGNPIINDASYDIKDIEEFQQVMKGFYKEKVIIDGGDSQVYLKSVKQSLEDVEVEWSGKEANDYAYLYDAFINTKEDSE
ncbi:hypothetical protein [Virgibacillus pantothenticus]|uniref:hypothetical protein n=1 Tax=Virgibacillus pantothenticus TaxID=1473 RepID=UPI000984AE17|nr:hypothetical protein [Virgibacillus pantothenticus]